MKRLVLALSAAAVIAGLPIAAVIAGNGSSDAAPPAPQQSEAADQSATDPSAPTEASPLSTAARPPSPIPVPNSGGGDDDDDSGDHDSGDDDSGDHG